MSKVRLEYIWMDGHKPTQKLRSKTKVMEDTIDSLEDIPDWGFDGSSTNQAEGNNSDCLLKPVCKVPDPIRGGHDLLVLCEVMNADGTVHSSNSRAELRKVSEKFKDQKAWFGIEQEYTLFGQKVDTQHHKVRFIAVSVPMKFMGVILLKNTYSYVSMLV